MKEEEFIVSKFYKLANDKSIKVKKIVAEDLDKIYENIKNKNKLLDIYKEYIQKENIFVRKIAIESFPKIIYFSDRSLQKELIEIFILILNESSMIINETAKKIVPEFLSALELNSAPTVLIDFLINCTNPELIIKIAHNFPAIIHAINVKQWESLRKFYLSLWDDKSIEIRKQLSKNIYDVALNLSAIGVGVDFLTQIFLERLKDKGDYVLELLKNSNKIIKLSKSKERKAEFISSLVLIKNNSGHTWRIREFIGKNLILYSQLFMQKSQSKEIWNLALDLCKDPVYEVMKSIVFDIAKLFDICGNSINYKENIKEIYRFATNRSWRRRQIFIMICYGARYNKGVFSLLQDNLMNLLHDSVRSIKICLINYILPISDEFGTMNKQIHKALDNDPFVISNKRIKKEKLFHSASGNMISDFIDEDQASEIDLDKILKEINDEKPLIERKYSVTMKVDEIDK